MQVLFSSEEGRAFYSGQGPQSGTADLPYRTKPTPTIISRQEGDAWKRPFVAVYEPFNGKENYTIERIENLDRSHTEDFSALKVFGKDGTQQIILQSTDKEKTNAKGDWKFCLYC